MNKLSNKNNIHQSWRISYDKTLVDNDHKYEYKSILSKRGKRRWRLREIEAEYGVNSEIHNVNDDQGRLDERCDRCKGYESF